MFREIRLWLFYHRYPEFRGPWSPEWVGTLWVEEAWRFAQGLGFDEACWWTPLTATDLSRAYELGSRRGKVGDE